MARAGNLDPLTKYKYTVHIRVDGDDNFFKKLSFQSVTSPRVDVLTQKYNEGGRHLNSRVIVEGATFSPVTMRRGKSFSNDFMNWIGAVWKGTYGDENGSSSNYRADIVIDHHDRRGNIVKKYRLLNAVPTMYMPTNGFDAMDDSEVSIETLTFEYEGYEEYSVDQQQLANVLGGAGSELLNLARGNKSVTSLDPGFEGLE